MRRPLIVALVALALAGPVLAIDGPGGVRAVTIVAVDEFQNF